MYFFIHLFKVDNLLKQPGANNSEPSYIRRETKANCRNILHVIQFLKQNKNAKNVKS